MLYIRQIDELAPLLEGTDHTDVKTVENSKGMREFIAAMLSYQPVWVTFLYHVRGVFVRFLGMKQEGSPKAPQMRPEDVSMMPGEAAWFFTVQQAREGEYWVAGIDDTHLSASLGVIAEPLPDGRNRYHVLTVVHYNNWAGTVYFNVIRPFHHLIIHLMIRNVAPS